MSSVHALRIASFNIYLKCDKVLISIKWYEEILTRK